MSRLFNMRLSDDDYSKLRQLRQWGVQVCDLLRGTIRSEHAKGKPGKRKKIDVETYFKELYERFPAPPGYVPPPRINTANRHEMRRYIVEHLEAKRKRTLK